MTQKNVSIEAFRFIFMIVICLLHIEGMVHTQNHGYLGVEFFFMLSGYFLYGSFLRHPEISTIDYTVKRLKRFFVEYAIVLVPVFFIYQHGVMETLRLESLLPFILKFFSELFFVHSIGIYPGAENWSTWYLSVLIVGGALIYALLRHNSKIAVSVILPVICIVTYSYFFREGGDTNIEHWETVCGVSMPLMRGISDMGLGIILCHILHRKPDIMENHALLINISSLLSLVFIFLLIICKQQNDAYMLIFCPIFLAGLFSEQSWLRSMFRSRVWTFLGGLSYEMLLVHLLVRAPLIYFNIYQQISPSLLIVLYLTVVLVLSYLLKEAGHLIRIKLKWE